MIADRWPLRRLYLAAKVTRRILFLQFVVRIAIAYPSCEVSVHLPQQASIFPGLAAPAPQVSVQPSLQQARVGWLMLKVVVTAVVIFQRFGELVGVLLDTV